MYDLRQLHILYADIIRIEQRADENKTRYIAGRILRIDADRLAGLRSLDQCMNIIHIRVNGFPELVGVMDLSVLRIHLVYQIKPVRRVVRFIDIALIKHECQGQDLVLGIDLSCLLVKLHDSGSSF